MDESKSLGRFIAKRRRHMRLTQQELAERIGVSKSAIAKWETDGGIPDRDNLKKLSEILNVTVDDLHGLIDSGHIGNFAVDVNITPDLIAALESYGYKVISPKNISVETEKEEKHEETDNHHNSDHDHD